MASAERFCWICYSSDPDSSYTYNKDSSAGPPGTTPRACASEWVHPCKCKGDTKWAHQGCLLAWIEVQSKHMLSLSSLNTSPGSQDVNSAINESLIDAAMLHARQGINATTASTNTPPENMNWRSRVLGMLPLRFYGANFSFENAATGSRLIQDSRRRTFIYSNTKLCCPQCRMPYQISQLSSNYTIIPWLESLQLLCKNALSYAFVTGVFFSGYTLLWTYGFASLSALFGMNEFHEICFNTLRDAHLFNFDTHYDQHLVTARNLLFLYIGVPSFPLSLIVTALNRANTSRYMSQFNILLMYYSSYLYLPSEPGFLYRVTPLVWLSYKNLRDRVFKAYNVKSGPSQLDQLLGEDEEGDGDGEEGVSLTTVNSPQASPTTPAVDEDEGDDYSTVEESLSSGSTSDIFSPMNENTFNGPNRDSSDTRPVVHEARFPIGSITSILLLPFVSSITGNILTRVFNPAIVLSPSTLVHKHPLYVLLSAIGKFLPLAFKNYLLKGYVFFGSLIHNLKPIHRNLLVGASLIVIKDMVAFTIAVESDRIRKSRKVLDCLS